MIVGTNSEALQAIEKRLGHGTDWLNAARSLSDGEFSPYPNFDTFRDAFAKSGAQTIDLFIQSLGRDHEKHQAHIAVATIFLHCEARASLQINDWYRELWNEILRQGGKTFPAGSLSVITFNYDRSLERYLAEKAEAAFGFSFDKAAEWISRIQISHIYGQIGSLRRDDGDAFIPWGSTHPNNLWKASGMLKLAKPRIDGAECAWCNSLRNAEKVIFLGFGFWPENIKLVQPHIPASASVYGSCLGLSEKDKKRALTAFQSMEWGEPLWTALNCLESWEMF